VWSRCGPFFNDLLENGADAQHLGGLLDRQGRRHVFFDVDGTREAFRQRALVESADRPQARRRAAFLAVPGYTGRKRGEVVRSRLAVQQAHTHEWLGTFGEAGNGTRWSRLDLAASAVAKYLQHHRFASEEGVLRMDGEYGWAHTALLLAQQGPGYLMRCSDYRLLDTPEAQAALERTSPRFTQIDTGTERDVYDVGWVPWSSEVDGGKTISTRLVVTSTCASREGEPKIGKRVGDRVYELFVTDRAPEAFTACDVLSLYFARGGFEQTLSEEDRELDPDRWVSGHPAGQEMWQILAQWIWNRRLRLGLIAAPCAPRCTLWSEAVPPVSEPESATETELLDAGDAAPPSHTDDAGPSTIEAVVSPTPTSLEEADALVETDEASSTTESSCFPAVPLAAEVRSSNSAASSITVRGFVLQPDGTLLCPENKVLRKAENRPKYGRIRFRARNADCRVCPRLAQCLGPKSSGRRGRRVNLPMAMVDQSASVALASRKEDTRAPATAPDGTPPPQARPVPQAPTPRRPPPPPARPGPQPLYWYDLPATALRRTLPRLLAQQRIDGLPAASTALPPGGPLSRDQRAHRRLRWDERLARNARPASAPAIRLQLHGVPASLAAYLGASATG
jgi:hypothetical protein